MKPDISELATSDTVRAGDAEREAAVRELTAHAAAGRLTSEELEARVETAYRARHVGELGELLADLPARRPVGSPRARSLVPLIAIAVLATTVAMTLAVGHPVFPLPLIFVLALVWRRGAGRPHPGRREAPA
jgi:hypothetical protein